MSERFVVDLPRNPNLSRGYSAVFATIAIWSLPSLFQFYLLRVYDPWTQNFYRYAIACLSILPFALVRRGRKIDLHAFKICLLPCLPNAAHQICQVLALNYMGPGVYAIFNRTSVIFTALLAIIFFPEERHVVRQWQFVVGTSLGLFGAFGVIWWQPGNHAQDRHIALPGFLIAFAAIFCWALYGIFVKRPSAELGSVRSFAVVSLITSTLLFPLMLMFGKIDIPLHAGVQMNFIMIASALVCITLAHVLYYVAIKEIGVALSQTLQLICPLGAVALSAWIFHERLTTPQIYSGTVLLAGAFIAMRVKPLATTESSENL